MNKSINCIRIWQPNDAPEKYRFYWDDVDFVAYVPKTLINGFMVDKIMNISPCATYTNQLDNGDFVITGVHA